MRIKSLNIGFMIAGILAFFACGHSGASGDGVFDENKLREPLIEANKHIVNTEDQHIKDFIVRYGWEMQTTGTGLRYAIVEKGNGTKAENGKIAILDYKVRLITGDLVYSSKQTGFKEFQIGRGGVEAGLEEAVLMMNSGDQGRFILPSHLAWGLSGDGDLIPPKSTIVYEIKVIDFK